MHAAVQSPGATTVPGAPAGYVPIGRADAVDRLPAGIRLRAGAATVEVTALAPDLFRIGLFGDGRPVVYPSEAIAKTDWPLVEVQIVDDHRAVRLITPAATAHVDLDPIRIRFVDAAGRVFAADDPALGMGFVVDPAPGKPIQRMLGTPARLYKRRPPTERYFGCGERTGGLEQTGSHPVFWNTNPPLGQTPDRKSLYVSIPFLLALDRGKAWGLFLDNAGRTEFDLAAERSDRIWLGVDGGDLVSYVFAGPAVRDVIDRYTELTGRTPMPPLWSLGYHQSRWSYASDAELRAVAREFRTRGIPCDVLYLDIDYMDGYRVFTWDSERFPDPKGLLSDLAAEGFHVVTIVDPGVKVDERYAVYVAGRAADLYCKTANGDEYHNVVWPGVCAFPDFTNPATRAWWGDLHAALVDQGVAGIWCDMNEPSGFIPAKSTLPPDAVHPGGGQPRLHCQVHNLYGSLMARATREGLLRLRPNARPFVISRAGFAGLQRHALHWTGDNSSWWEHLWLSMPQLQNLGLSGLAWAGVDVGGFADNATGELLARWTEFGIFQPFCRNHSQQGTRRQEPWAFGEPYESVIRAMLQLRQRLIPYLYTLFEECHRTGAPILRPLLFENPADETTYTTDDEFLVGRGLLVAPITRPGVEHRHVYLPAGTWFHFWSGERFDGPAHILARAPLGQPAIYVRANTPIPLWPVMSYVGERPADPLTVLLYPAEGAGELTVYEDAGDGFEHERGDFARTRIDCEATAARVTVRIGERVGAFAPARTTVELEVRGFRRPPGQVTIDGMPTDRWRWEADTLVVPLPATAAAQVVQIDR